MLTILRSARAGSPRRRRPPDQGARTQAAKRGQSSLDGGRARKYVDRKTPLTRVRRPTDGWCSTRRARRPQEAQRFRDVPWGNLGKTPNIAGAPTQSNPAEQPNAPHPSSRATIAWGKPGIDRLKGLAAQAGTASEVEREEAEGSASARAPQAEELQKLYRRSRSRRGQAGFKKVTTLLDD